MLPLLLLSCVTAPEPAPRGACDPLQTELCALPWPSAFYQAEDAEALTGWRLDLADSSLPVDDAGQQVLPHHWNQKDGFSTVTPILAWVPEPDPERMWGPTELGRYAEADAAVLLINADTGARAPIWVELDARADDDQLLVIRPAQPLAHASRYVVAIHQSIDPGAEPSAATLSLRDDTPALDWDTEARRERFEDLVFPSIEAQGMARGELLLAWDFVTASAEGSLADPLAMMQDAVEAMPPEGPSYVIESEERGDCEAGPIGLTLRGTLTAPRYTVDDGPATLLARGDDGAPQQVGDTSVPFLVRVPCSLLDGGRPGFVLQYGHGLLQSRDELLQDYLGELLDRFGWVGLAVDWVGLADADLPAVAALFREDISEFAQVPERCLQSFVNQEYALQMALRGLYQDPALQVEGRPVIDPERYGFWGNSAGGILGGAYVALSASHPRAALGVTGGPFTTILPRSVNYDPFELLLKNRYSDDRDLALLLAAFQTLWDPADVGGWARVMNQEPLEGREPKHVLLQSGLGDAQVSVVGAELLARAFGASALRPVARETWGVPAVEAPIVRSALVIWDYPDGSEEPAEAVPPARSGDTHLCPRREREAQDQVRDFLELGVVNQTCDGVCEGLREGLCD